MRIKLTDLQIENFKGIKQFNFSPNEHTTAIIGANGTGKTTVYDAFLWLFFRKDSTGRKDFQIRPLDKKNQPIEKIVTKVESTFVIDGFYRRFRKEMHERRTKGQLKGYETLCWIDDVPRKVSEYDYYVLEIIEEDIFKMITDLHYFCEKLHWTDRRVILMKYTGEIKTPEEFKSLIDAMAGRELDDYRKVILDQKKRIVKERDEIGPRIDELQKSLVEYATETDVAGLELRRKELQGISISLDEKRKELSDSESKRAKEIDRINELKSQRVSRETALKNDTLGHQPLFDEKNDIERKLSEKELAVKSLENRILSLKADISTRESQLDSCCAGLERIKKDYLELKDMDFSSTVCTACGQTLPADKIESLKEANQAKMKRLAAMGNQAKTERDNNNKAIDDLNAELSLLEDDTNKAKLELTELKTHAQSRLMQIDTMLNNRVKIKPEDDPVWKQLSADIKQAEAEIGAPLSEQIEEIQKKQDETKELLNKIDKALSASDTTKQTHDRIKELKELEKRLSIQITGLDGTLNEIGEFQAYQSSQIENAVNGRFKHVNFKLFNTLLNGSIEPCCEAMLNGTPYSDCSYGEKDLIGADIINVLSEEYLVSAPVFVDNAESLTLDLELQCQQIHLKAVDGVTKLTVEEPKQNITIDSISVKELKPGEELIQNGDIQSKENRIVEEITPNAETPPPVDVQEEHVARSDEIESDSIETVESVEQEQPTVSGLYHCDCCKSDFDIPSGKKKNLCPNCYSNKIKEK